MAHENRGRLAVDPDGNWRLCTATLPEGVEVFGTVTYPDGEKGALVRFPKTGVYASVIAGATRSVDGRKVRAALGIQGRPTLLEGGKRINVYLDAESLDTAQKIGGGNASEGIRIALAEGAHGRATTPPA